MLTMAFKQTQLEKSNSFLLHTDNYCIRHIFRRGFIFANFASRMLFPNLTTREKFTSNPDPGNSTCVRNTSSTAHSARANEWMILIWVISPSLALLLDREFNHRRKCLQVPIREKLTRKIYGVYSIQDLYQKLGNVYHFFFLWSPKIGLPQIYLPNQPSASTKCH